MKSTLFTRISFTFLLLAAVLSGCEAIENIGCERGEGARITEVRDLAEYTGVILDMPGEVYITQGDTFAFSIEAQENILGKIATDVRGEVLEISKTGCLGNHKVIRVRLMLPALLSLEVEGAGDVYGESVFESDALRLIVDGSGSIELDAKVGKAEIYMDGRGSIISNLEVVSLDSKLDGSGDLMLSGSASAHNVEVMSSGNLYAFDFTTLYSSILVDGRGNAEVFAQDSLSVRIKGSGNVLYKGSPRISSDITGSGDLRDAN